MIITSRKEEPTVNVAFLEQQLEQALLSADEWERRARNMAKLADKWKDAYIELLVEQLDESLKNAK